jgi:hypothetical protein
MSEKVENKAHESGASFPQSGRTTIAKPCSHSFRTESKNQLVEPTIIEKTGVLGVHISTFHECGLLRLDFARGIFSEGRIDAL